MSYLSGEKLIEELVEGFSSFKDNNTNRGDWLVLNSGNSDHYAILRPGASTIEWITLSHYRPFWATIIEVWQQYGGGDSDTQSLTKLEALSQEILDGMLPYRKLRDPTGDVLESKISEMGEVEEIIINGALEWIRQNITVAWSEDIAVTFEE